MNKKSSSSSSSSSVKKTLKIINISSGDGELIYLNSKIRDDIKSIKNLDQWTNYVDSIKKLYSKGYLLLLLLLLHLINNHIYVINDQFFLYRF